MPRKARLDITGTLHHVMARGIERSAIFRKLGDGGAILTFDSEKLGHVGFKPRQSCLSNYRR